MYFYAILFCFELIITITWPLSLETHTILIFDLKVSNINMRCLFCRSWQAVQYEHLFIAIGDGEKRVFTCKDRCRYSRKRAKVRQKNTNTILLKLLLATTLPLSSTTRCYRPGRRPRPCPAWALLRCFSRRGDEAWPLRPKTTSSLSTTASRDRRTRIHDRHMRFQGPNQPILSTDQFLLARRSVP